MKRRYSKEEISKILNNIDKEVRSGASKDAASKKEGITVQTFYRWQKSFKPNDDQSLRLIRLLKNDEKLKRLVADYLLEKELQKSPDL